MTEYVGMAMSLPAKLGIRRNLVLRALKNPGYASEQFGSSTNDPSDIKKCFEDAARLAETERRFIEANAEIKFDELWDWFDKNNVYWRKNLM